MQSVPTQRRRRLYNKTLAGGRVFFLEIREHLVEYFLFIGEHLVHMLLHGRHIRLHLRNIGLGQWCRGRIGRRSFAVGIHHDRAFQAVRSVDDFGIGFAIDVRSHGIRGRR